MNTTFADTILNISLTGPLVRIELGTLKATVGADGKQQLHPTLTQELVMPLEGFVRAFSMQESVIKKLMADGVLTPKDPAPAA